MTIMQKQCLLCYLGHYGGAIDGIWGPQSKAATENLQKQQGLTADGDFGPETEKKILAVICQGRKMGDWWETVEFFTPQEFACKCGRYCNGYPAEMEETLVKAAEGLRRHFGVPVTVSSGLRCSQHNANVDGVSNSRHLSGKAMDFSVAGTASGAVLTYLQTRPEIRYAYAIDGSFVHMDVL